MPRRNSSGPMGGGAMTGRGFGPCGAGKQVGFAGNRGMRAGVGAGCRPGFAGRRGVFSVNENSPETHKKFLEEEKQFLENRLECIDKQIEDL